jgi:DNA-binding CsgD family transcriptional regulator
METDVLLTRRQNDVLQLLKRGLPQKKIADILGISVRTVQEHIYSMCEKFGVSGQLELVSYAYRNGL